MQSNKVVQPSGVSVPIASVTSNNTVQSGIQTAPGLAVNESLDASNRVVEPVRLPVCLDAFFDTWDRLAAHSEHAQFKQAVLDAAERLIGQLHAMSQNMTRIQAQAAACRLGFDASVTAFMQAMDSWVAQLILSVNALYNPNGQGANFFDPGQMTASDIRLASDLSAATLVASHLDAVAISALQTKVFGESASDKIQGTLGDYYVTTMERVVQDVDKLASILAHPMPKFEPIDCCGCILL